MMNVIIFYRYVRRLVLMTVLTIDIKEFLF